MTRRALCIAATTVWAAFCIGAGLDLWPRRLPWSTGPAALDPLPRPHKVWRGTYAGLWLQRHLAARWRRPTPPAQVVLVGDSITHGWDRVGPESWAHHLAPRGAVNLGFAGDRTQHVLWRLAHGELAGRSPAVVVLSIGSNNLLDDPPAEVDRAIGRILDRVRADVPEATVLLQAVLPRGADPGDPLRAAIAEANRLLVARADGERVVWVDPSACFLDARGAIPKSRMSDGIHPTADGYACLAAALEPALAAATGTPYRDPLPEAAW